MNSEQNFAAEMAAFLPVVVTPPKAAAPVASAGHTSTVIGRTTMIGVVPGQDSSAFPRKKGLNFEYFYVGEPVSVSRSDGRRCIAEVLSVSSAEMTVSVGGGIQKTYAPADIPLNVSKLMAGFYFHS